MYKIYLIGCMESIPATVKTCIMKWYHARVGAAPLITDAPLTLKGAFISQLYKLHLGSS